MNILAQNDGADKLRKNGEEKKASSAYAAVTRETQQKKNRNLWREKRTLFGCGSAFTCFMYTFRVDWLTHHEVFFCSSPSWSWSWSPSSSSSSVLNMCVHRIVCNSIFLRATRMFCRRMHAGRWCVRVQCRDCERTVRDCTATVIHIANFIYFIFHLLNVVPRVRSCRIFFSLLLLLWIFASLFMFLVFCVRDTPELCLPFRIASMNECVARELSDTFFISVLCVVFFLCDCDWLCVHERTVSRMYFLATTRSTVYDASIYSPCFAYIVSCLSCARVFTTDNFIYVLRLLTSHNNMQ